MTRAVDLNRVVGWFWVCVGGMGVLAHAVSFATLLPFYRSVGGFFSGYMDVLKEKPAEGPLVVAGVACVVGGTALIAKKPWALKFLRVLTWFLLAGAVAGLFFAMSPWLSEIRSVTASNTPGLGRLFFTVLGAMVVLLFWLAWIFVVRLIQRLLRELEPQS